MLTRSISFAQCFALAICAFVCLSGSWASATVITGAGGRGVPANNSSLIGVYDYSDSFTGAADGGSNAARVYVAAVQTAPAYVVENTHGHPAVNLQSQSQGPGVAEFSFASDGPGTPGLVNGTPSYPGTSGAGSATGFTQTGGNLDYGVAYGFRTRYVVQADFVATSDRIDITTGPTAGTIFGGPNSLSVFVRGDGSGGISLYNGTDTPVPGFATGLTNDGQWHNYAVLFDQVAKTLEVFIDEQSKGSVNLNTFAGGAYANFSNAAVGVGAGLGGGQDRTWSDNFQVGAPVPEPSSLALLALGAVGLLCKFGRRSSVK